jgi:hypothetical protein
MEVLMLIRTFVALALMVAFPLAADAAGAKKYPKAGVNCGLKNANCSNKCTSTPIDGNSVRSINARNECLNNCTIAYDLCLGAPARPGTANGDLTPVPDATPTSP